MERASVTLPAEQKAWLEDKVARKIFASLSHGIQYCVQREIDIEKEEKERLRPLQVFGTEKKIS